MFLISFLFSRAVNTSKLAIYMWGVHNISRLGVLYVHLHIFHPITITFLLSFHTFPLFAFWVSLSIPTSHRCHFLVVLADREFNLVSSHACRSLVKCSARSIH